MDKDVKEEIKLSPMIFQLDLQDPPTLGGN